MEQNIKKAHDKGRMGRLQVIVGKKTSQKDRKEITGVSRKERDRTSGRKRV